MMDLTIIIVSYNTFRYIIDCIESVYRETKDTRFEIFVVDNQSSDDTVRQIRLRYPDVSIYVAEKNMGFARANNYAAQNASGEYLLLLNPDTLVLEKAIDKLLVFARSHEHAGIWGGRTLFADGRLNPSSCWRRMTLWNIMCRSFGLGGLFATSRLFNSEAYGGWNRDTVSNVDIVSGCFFMIRRRDWRALAGFDPEFFMYGEEADLCLRARSLLGFRPMVTPQATIVHHGGGSYNDVSEKARAQGIANVLAARVRLIRKHFPRWQQGFALSLIRLWPLMKIARHSLPMRTSERNKRSVWIEVEKLYQYWKNGIFLGGQH